MPAVPDMASAPLCPQQGLWSAAWCLLLTTGTLTCDCTVFAWEQMMPQARATLEPLWSMLFLLPPITIAGGWIDVAWEKLRKATSEAITRAAPVVSKRIEAELEARRAAFIDRFPQHASLLPAGEFVNLVGTIAWLAVSLMLTWRFAKAFGDGGNRHQRSFSSRIEAADTWQGCALKFELLVDESGWPCTCSPTTTYVRCSCKPTSEAWTCESLLTMSTRRHTEHRHGW